MTTQAMTTQARQAELFASLHKPGDPLLLANAWDVASAVAIATAGAKAIATTSAGVAWSVGVPDAGEAAGVAAGLDADLVASVIGRIAAAVPLPVSADIEAGYGEAPEDVAATVAAVVAAGAVGVNLEDRRDATSLYEPAEQAGRLAAARAAASIPLWINARTDVFLSGAYPDPAAAVAATQQRAAVYQQAGADSLFVPGLVDLDAIAELTKGPLPIAVMVWPGAPNVAELTAVGVVRISLGSAIAQAAYGLAARAAAEMFTAGTYHSSAGGFDYGAMNAALQRAAGGVLPVVADEVAETGHPVDQAFVLQQLHGSARRPPGCRLLTAQHRDRRHPAPGRQLSRLDLAAQQRGKPHVLTRICMPDHPHTQDLRRALLKLVDYSRRFPDISPATYVHLGTASAIGRVVSNP